MSTAKTNKIGKFMLNFGWKSCRDEGTHIYRHRRHRYAEHFLRWNERVTWMEHVNSRRERKVRRGREVNVENFAGLLVFLNSQFTGHTQQKDIENCSIVLARIMRKSAKTECNSTWWNVLPRDLFCFFFLFFSALSSRRSRRINKYSC